MPRRPAILSPGSNNLGLSTNKEISMRSLLTTIVLMLTATAAFAEPVPVPEPETLSLLGIGVAAMLMLGRKK